MAVDCVERVCVDASRMFVIPAFVSDLEQRQKAGYSGIVELYGIDGEGQFESSTVGRTGQNQEPTPPHGSARRRASGWCT